MEADSILNPIQFIGSVEWREPVTTLTDFLVALVCWTAFYFFQRQKSSSHVSYPWFRGYFLVFAIGMTSAAWLGHGFQAYVSPKTKMIGWICGATGIGFLQMGSLRAIEELIKPSLRKVLPYVFFFEWLVAVSLMIGLFDFRVTQVNSAFGLVGLVLPMHIYRYLKTKKAGSKWIIGALAYSLIPGIVYSNQISISRWFNYHDISHVLMAVFMTLMFMGLHRIISPNSAN